MNRSIAFLGLIGFCLALALARESRDANFVPSPDISIVEESISPRIYLNNNNTMLTVGLIPFALGMAAIIGLLLLVVVPFLVPMGESIEDYSTGYSAGGDSYSSYARSYNPYAIDWETFSILDWIAIAEETWKKFEPGNLDCQKRLVCEIHQNTPKFGFVAKRMVDAFSYLEYAQVLRLPEQLKTIIEGYLDAADRGRSMKKDCGEVYSGCDFSVSKIVDRVSHNEI